MRIVVLIVLPAGSVFYTYVTFADLGFLTRTGCPGPGLLPAHHRPRGRRRNVLDADRRAAQGRT